MGLTKVVLNKAALASLIASSEIADAMRDEFGHPVLEEAQAIAPVLTGNYRDQLRLEDADDGGVRVVAGAEYAIYVEADQGVLVRALDAAGGR